MSRGGAVAFNAALMSFFLAGWIVSAPGPSSAQVAGGEQDDRYRFRVSVDMVSLSVTAFDQDRKLVTDLDKENFTVYEDGVKQEIEVFSREDLPLRMVILLDTSWSMLMRMSMAQEAAIRFVRSLKPDDRVKVVEFNDRVLILVDFTSDFDHVAEAVRQTTPQGNTSLYNALYISLRSLSRRRNGIERQAIVLLSDGADTHSLVSFEDVRELARKTDVMIYGVCLLASKDPTREESINAKYALNKLASETGGSLFIPEKIEDLAGVYDSIAAELKSQYNLGYTSTNGKADGGWRRTQVFCNRSGIQVRTRTGYYAPHTRAGRGSFKSK